jgi:hypothetical protein
MAVLLICVAILLSVRLGLYSNLNIQSYQRAPSTISALNIIAAHFENKTPMTHNELVFLDNVMPPQQNERDWPYNCYSNDDLFFRDRLKFNFILTHEMEIWQLPED